ncbi:SGNH/GDSL hydrolase family protein [Selenomonas ruminantium]|uniref:SGNH/GDSL hydrolase family protein n=1 Tax=Selenomonas ruminantium TaxID=971 RepID=UPI000479818F|nr:SGNH/GDSL hydrolase family protein [Selenomonas ruminantium]
MINVLLLGDSIRQNYDDYVRQKLKGRAMVFFPNDNCRFTQFTLRYLHDWYRVVLDGAIPDVVHFNNGLWDVLRLSNESNTFNDLDTYLNLLSRIVERVWFLSPNTEIIFATTTPVKEPGFTPGMDFGCRCNSDIEYFNQAAVKMFFEKKYRNDKQVLINDLYQVALSLPESAHSDDVHYDTEIGTVALGDAVVRAIYPFVK